MHSGPNHAGPPAGFEAPIRQALTRVYTVGGLPRELFGAWIAACAGAWLLYSSYGWILVYLAGYAIMVYLTKRDPWWAQISASYLVYWAKLYPTVAWALGITVGGFAIIMMMTILISW